MIFIKMSLSQLFFHSISAFFFAILPLVTTGSVRPGKHANLMIFIKMSLSQLFFHSISKFCPKVLYFALFYFFFVDFMSLRNFCPECLCRASRGSSGFGRDERQTASPGVNDTVLISRTVHESMSDQHRRSQLGTSR